MEPIIPRAKNVDLSTKKRNGLRSAKPGAQRITAAIWTSHGIRWNPNETFFEYKVEVVGCKTHLMKGGGVDEMDVSPCHPLYGVWRNTAVLSMT